jgi:hypothetical protein
VNKKTHSADEAPQGRVLVSWGSSDFPVEAVLGPKTRWALEHAQSATPFIIKRRSSGALDSAQILATGLPLTADQLQLIRDAAHEPRAYYIGRPVFKRLPPDQDFAIQLHAGSDTLDLMIGLQNRSWGFYCGDERYQAWHWVGSVFKYIAKSAFPQYASPSKQSVWRRGVLTELERAFDQAQQK